MNEDKPKRINEVLPRYLGFEFEHCRDDDTNKSVFLLSECSLSEPVSPTAVEMLLPWKRNTGRDPVSCTLIHSLPMDDEPQLGEVPSWVNNEDYTTPAVASEEIVERSNCQHIDNPPVVSDDQCCDSSTGELPLPWQTKETESEPAPCSWNTPNTDNIVVPSHWSAPSLQNDTDNSHSDENGNNPLPLPWHCEPATTESPCMKESQHNNPGMYGDYDSPPLPWRCNIGQNCEADVSYRTKGAAVPSNPSKSCPVFHTTSPSEVEEDPTECIPPPPWRSNSNIDVSLDQQAPRPAGSVPCPRPEKKNNHNIPPLPWRTNSGSNDDTDPMCSPSLSHDMDVFSLRPQPSSHSFRFSEAESKHSEHMHLHHHMIELQQLHNNHSTELEEEVMLDLDTEQLDVHERVCNWLEASEAHLYEPSEDEPFLPTGADTQDVTGGLVDCDSAAESFA